MAISVMKKNKARWVGSARAGVTLFIYFVVLGLELRAYTLSHSTSPFFMMGCF
jgi:hypothetical protein